ncbi:Lin1244/Lin1753 domain-containing protein, partial [Bacteroidota bacterium]
MAREQRHDVDYFPHECIHGRKMHIIETKFGNDGYATWFKLLEQLGKANYHYLDISDEMNLMFLVSIFKVSEEKALLILETLAKLEAIDKFLYEEHQIIYSQKFAESVKDAYRKRKSEIIQYSDLLKHLNIKSIQSGGSLTPVQSKKAVVIPKEKKSKEEKRKEDDEVQTFEDVLIDIDISFSNYLKNSRLITA